MDVIGGVVRKAMAPVVTAAELLGSEDLHGVDSGSLLSDVTALRGLLDQVEGEWLRRG